MCTSSSSAAHSLADPSPLISLFGEVFKDLLPGNFAKLVPPEGQDLMEGLEVKVRLGSVWKQSLTELSGGQRLVIVTHLAQHQLTSISDLSSPSLSSCRCFSSSPHPCTFWMRSTLLSIFHIPSILDSCSAPDLRVRSSLWSASRRDSSRTRTSSSAHASATGQVLWSARPTATWSLTPGETARRTKAEEGDDDVGVCSCSIAALITIAICMVSYIGQPIKFCGVRV
jgi:hypothetical protein